MKVTCKCFSYPYRNRDSLKLTLLRDFFNENTSEQSPTSSSGSTKRPTYQMDSSDILHVLKSCQTGKFTFEKDIFRVFYLQVGCVVSQCV